MQNNRTQQAKTPGQKKDIIEDKPSVSSEQAGLPPIHPDMEPPLGALPEQTDHPSEPPVRIDVAAGQHPCPKCKREMALVTERVHNNGIVRQYRCSKCGEFVTED